MQGFFLTEWKCSHKSQNSCPNIWTEFSKTDHSVNDDEIFRFDDTVAQKEKTSVRAENEDSTWTS